MGEAEQGREESQEGRNLTKVSEVTLTYEHRRAPGCEVSLKVTQVGSKGTQSFTPLLSSNLWRLTLGGCKFLGTFYSGQSKDAPGRGKKWGCYWKWEEEVQ